MWEQTRGHRQGRAEEKWAVKQAVLMLQHHLAQREKMPVVLAVTILGAETELGLFNLLLTGITV